MGSVERRKGEVGDLSLICPFTCLPYNLNHNLYFNKRYFFSGNVNVGQFVFPHVSKRLWEKKRGPNASMLS
jgi:hypothetical protein